MYLDMYLDYIVRIIDINICHYIAWLHLHKVVTYQSSKQFRLQHSLYPTATHNVSTMTFHLTKAPKYNDIV